MIENIRYPNMTKGAAPGIQTDELRRYLYQLADLLNLELASIEARLKALEDGKNGGSQG